MMMANIFGASKAKNKTDAADGDDDKERSVLSNKDLRSGGVEDDDNSDGFLVIDENKDGVDGQDDDDVDNDADVESYSSWDKVDVIEESSTQPSPPSTTTVTKATTNLGEQQLRSSLNFDGYMEVDDDADNDKVGIKQSGNKNEKTCDTIIKKIPTNPPTVLFDSTLNMEGYMEVCLFQEEQVQDAIRQEEEDSDPIVVLEGVLMPKKSNAYRGRHIVLVCIVLFTIVVRVMFSLCHSDGNGNNNNVLNGRGAIPPAPETTLLAWNATNNSNSSYIHTTKSIPWLLGLRTVLLPTETVCQARDNNKSNTEVWINDSIVIKEHSSSSNINASIIVMPHNVNDMAAISFKNNTISAWHRHHCAAVLSFPATAKISASYSTKEYELTMVPDDDEDDDLNYYDTVELLSAKRHHVGTVVKNQSDFAAMLRQGQEEFSKTIRLFQQLHHTLCEMGYVDCCFHHRHHHATLNNTTLIATSFAPRMNHHQFSSLKPLYTVQVEHAPPEQQWSFFEQNNLDRAVMNWSPRRSQEQMTKSLPLFPSISAGSALFSAQPGTVNSSTTSSDSGAVGFLNESFLFMGGPPTTLHQFEAQGFTTRWDFNISRGVFGAHHCQYPVSTMECTGNAEWEYKPRFLLASSSRRSLGRCHHDSSRHLVLHRCEQQHSLRATASLVAVRSNSAIGFSNGPSVRKDHSKAAPMKRSALDETTHRNKVSTDVWIRSNNFRRRTLNTSTPPHGTIITRNATTLVIPRQSLPCIQSKAMLLGNLTRAFSISQSKISWIPKTIKDDMTFLVPRLQHERSIHNLIKVTPVGALIAYKKASSPLILRNMNATQLMPHLRKSMSTPRQIEKQSTVGSALIVRTEGVPSEMKRNVTRALDLAKLQMQYVDEKRNNDKNNNRYKTTGALVILQQPMSPVVIGTTPAQIQLQQLPVTVVVASEKNQSQVVDQETGQLVIVNNPLWKTPEPGSIRVYLAARSMFLALILMNKKDLSLINYPFKTASTAVSVWPAVDYYHYGMNTNYCWTKIEVHFYSLILQLHQHEHDDSVAIRVKVDENMNSPCNFAHAVLSASPSNMLLLSE